MNKPDSIIAYECKRIMEGKSMMLPDKDHFDYLYKRASESFNGSDFGYKNDFESDVAEGEKLAEEFYKNL